MSGAVWSTAAAVARSCDHPVLADLAAHAAVLHLVDQEVWGRELGLARIAVREPLEEGQPVEGERGVQVDPQSRWSGELLAQLLGQLAHADRPDLGLGHEIVPRDPRDA